MVLAFTNHISQANHPKKCLFAINRYPSVLGSYINFHMYQLDKGINWVSSYCLKDTKLDKGINWVLGYCLKDTKQDKGIKDLQNYPSK
jgi:hypothetical protein